MEVTVLGSGAAFNGERNPSGYAVRLESRLVLLDFGFGNLRQLHRAGLEPADVTDVFFSHRHPDHVGDLPALLFSYRYGAKPRSGRLHLWGPSGFKAFLRRLQGAHEPWCGARGFAIEARELAAGRGAARDGWTMESMRVPHPTPALAYRLSYKGKSLVYSGDTGFCPDLADFAAEADLFLLECANGEKSAYPWHMKPRLALATLEASGCRRGLVTHLSPEAEAGLRRLSLPRGVSLARDLQRLRL